MDWNSNFICLSTQQSMNHHGEMFAIKKTDGKKGREESESCASSAAVSAAVLFCMVAVL